MKTLVTSDLQWSDNSRDKYRLDFVGTLHKLIHKYKVDSLYLLGDLTEAKDNHPASLVNTIVNDVHSLSELCDVTILQGNHDFSNINHPFFEFLNRFENVKWISTPTIRDLCLFLPHTRDYKKDWAKIDLKGNYDFIFAHNIFTGVCAANGHALSGIPPSVFAKDAHVISGDVHEPQTFGCITYVGPPYLCDYGDSYEPRVILLDGVKETSIKVGGPQKRLVDLTWPGKLTDQANAGDIVKIQVHLEMEHVAKWAEIRSNLEKQAHDLNWQLNTIQPLVTYVPAKGGVAAKHQNKSDKDYIDGFSKRFGLDKETFKVGLVLMEQED